MFFFLPAFSARMKVLHRMKVWEAVPRASSLTRIESAKPRKNEVRFRTCAVGNLHFESLRACDLKFYASAASAPSLLNACKQTSMKHSNIKSQLRLENIFTQPSSSFLRSRQTVEI